MHQTSGRALLAGLWQDYANFTFRRRVAAVRHSRDSALPIDSAQRDRVISFQGSSECHC
jgi:hypothetical protein